MWLLSFMLALRALPGVELLAGDQCRLGAPWQKPTGWLTNAPFLNIVTQKHCHTTCPNHVKLTGKIWIDG